MQKTSGGVTAARSTLATTTAGQEGAKFRSDCTGEGMGGGGGWEGVGGGIHRS